MKKKIAVVYGGYSSEIIVSKKSAEGVCSFIDKDKFDVYPVLIDKDKWCALIDENEYIISKDDFSFTINTEKIIPDCVYITIHGTPGENGLLQGYLKMLGIPHSTCDVLPAAITFNKFFCNSFLNNFGVNTANAVLIRKNEEYNIDDIVDETGFPCFVKPNAGGSSFGISKVNKLEELAPAIEKAFNESSEVIIEQFIEGVEITCGLYKTLEKTVIFPLTMVISQNEFFDFNAKYKGESQEITPAPIDDLIANAIQKTSSFIYGLLDCKGFIRIDYIVQKEQIFLLEVNTTPGMTSTSFIPQQISATGLNIKDVFTEIIEDAINRK
jgi:D-alanine-D-alanine ligase